jgi:hypothetical protein
MKNVLSLLKYQKILNCFNAVIKTFENICLVLHAVCGCLFAATKRPLSVPRDECQEGCKRLSQGLDN